MARRASAQATLVPATLVQAMLRPSSRRFRLLIAAFVTACLLASCSEAEPDGNEQAFCALLADGVGLFEADVSLGDFTRLNAVAPTEIRPTVNRLRNAALDLSEIDPLDVEALFNARFDPNALNARAALESYAISTCELDLDGGPPVPIDTLAENLRTYLDENFASAPWVNNITLEPGTVTGRLESVIAQLVNPPGSDAEAGEVCRALSVYLYEISNGGGTITVQHNSDVVAFRSGREASCMTL